MPIVKQIPFIDVWPLVNTRFFLSHYLGVKPPYDQSNPKYEQAMSSVSPVLDWIAQDKIIIPKMVYKLFKARSDGDDLIIFNDKENEIERFLFPRQSQDERLSLTDFVAADQMDSVAFFVGTTGQGIAPLIQQLNQEAEYVKSHILTSITLASAEGLAQWIHNAINEMKSGKTIRVSFGYPMCPDLSYQKRLFQILKPEKYINVSLSDSFMMSPEASVSAMVIHHPNARYFNIE